MACSIEGCDGPVLARGWCNSHYLRWRRNGNPVGVRFLPTEELFWQKVNKTDICWLWTAAVSTKGYGLFQRNLAHRVSYELLVGPIPEGMHVDHLCRVRHCVNPDHLEAVTTQENTRRGARATQTHCLRGHPFDERNTYVRPDGRGRLCRACRLERVKEMAPSLG